MNIRAVILIWCFGIVAAVDSSVLDQNGKDDRNLTVIEFDSGRLIQNGNPSSSSLLFSYTYTRNKDAQPEPVSSSDTTVDISKINGDLVKTFIRPSPRSERPRPFYLPK